MVLDLDYNFLSEVGIFYTHASVVLLKYMAAIFILSKAKGLELAGEEQRFESTSKKLPSQPKTDFSAQLLTFFF